MLIIFKYSKTSFLKFPQGHNLVIGHFEIRLINNIKGLLLL